MSKSNPPRVANDDENDVSKIVGKAGVAIWSRDGSECGVTTGQVEPAVQIKWPDGAVTWICTAELLQEKGRWQIRPTPSKRPGATPK